MTVCYPPDTDTPGYEEENKTKPIETKLISESAGLFKVTNVKLGYCSGGGRSLVRSTLLWDWCELSPDMNCVTNCSACDLVYTLQR